MLACLSTGAGPWTHTGASDDASRIATYAKVALSRSGQKAGCDCSTSPNLDHRPLVVR